MIPLLLTNWRAIAEGLIVGGLALWLGITRMELAQTKANWATERATAIAAAADFTAKSAAKDATNAELSRDLEVIRAKTIADAAASADDFAVKLRDATDAARHRCVSAPAAAARVNAPTPSGGDDGHRSDAAGLRIRTLVKQLQADVAECWAFGAAHGR